MHLRRTVSPATFRRVTWWALAAQIAIVLTGAAVRLTGSGLGCTDWPGCTQDRLIPAWGWHRWIEFGNRLLTFAVIASAAAAMVAARWRQPYRRAGFALSAVLAAGIVAQALIGAVLVIFELDPRLTVLHFATSILLISAATALVHCSAEDGGLQGTSLVGTMHSGRDETPLLHRGALGPLSSALGVATGILVCTGTIVTGSGPHGGDDRAERFGFDLPNVTRLHSVAMWVFLALLVGLMVVVSRSPLAWVLLRPNLSAILALSVAQAVLGYLQYSLGVPAGLVALHVLGSTLVCCAVVALVLKVHSATTLTGESSRPVFSPK